MAFRRFLSSNRLSGDRPWKVLFCGHEFTNGFRFSKEALAKFPNVTTVQCSRADLHEELKNADVVLPLMCRIGPTELAIGRNVKMIMQFGVGLEGVDVPSATQQGVWVCKIPSEGTGNAQSCAEHAIYLALAVLRNVHEMNRSLKTGGLGNPMGRTLYKSRAIIYGYGGIGKQLLHRLKAFDMNILVVSRGLPPESATGDNSAVTWTTTARFPQEESVSQADILFVCCSQNAENRGFVNKDFIRLLKPGVIIVNVARGGLVNYDDVHAALLTGAVGGLGTDVFHTEPFPPEDALLQLPGVVATPHIAGVTEVSYRSMAQKVAENVDRVMRGLPPVGSVNSVLSGPESLNVK